MEMTAKVAIAAAINVTIMLLMVSLGLQTTHRDLLRLWRRPRLLVGCLIAALGVGFGLFLLAMRLIHGREWAVSGVFTLFAVLFFFVGAQFVGMGMMGEYIGRIYLDVRGRPRYFVERVVGSSKLEK